MFPFFSHAFWLLSVDVASHEICEVYIQSNRQNKFQQEFLSLWLECTNPANCSQLKLQFTCLLYLCLCTCGASQNKLGWITLEELHRMCCWPSLEQQAHTKTPCLQAGRDSNGFLTCTNQEGLFPSLYSPIWWCFSCWVHSATSHVPKLPPGVHPPSSDPAQPPLGMRSCSPLFPSLEPHSSCLPQHPALPPNFVSWLFIMVGGPEFLQTSERQKKCVSLLQSAEGFVKA